MLYPDRIPFLYFLSFSPVFLLHIICSLALSTYIDIATSNSTPITADLGSDSTPSVDITLPQTRRAFTSMLFGPSSSTQRNADGPLGSRCEGSACVDIEEGTAKNWEKLGGPKVGQKNAPLLSVKRDDVAVDKVIIPVKIIGGFPSGKDEGEGVEGGSKTVGQIGEIRRGGEEGVERRDLKGRGGGVKEGGVRYSIEDSRGQRLASDKSSKSIQVQSGKEDSSTDRYTERGGVCAQSPAHAAVKKVILFSANTSLEIDSSLTGDRPASNARMNESHVREEGKSAPSASGKNVSSVVSSVADSRTVKRLRRIKSTFSVSFRRQFRLFNRSIG